MPEVSDRICIAAIAGPHGVQGGVRIKCFTEDPKRVASYGPVWNEAGTHSYRLKVTGITGKPDVVRATIKGVTDRDQADALKGTRLYVDRANLPEAEEDDFYHSDLIGLKVEDEDGEAIGEVRGVFDFGAGDLVEIAMLDGERASCSSSQREDESPRSGEASPRRRLVMLPFTKAAVPVVDVKGGRLVVDGNSGFFQETTKAQEGE